MKVVIGGGSGYVGQALAASLVGGRPRGLRPLAASRPRRVPWEDAAAEVDGAGAVVNLAGVSIGGPRWTRSRKAAILGSRVETTQALAAAIAAAAEPARGLRHRFGHRLLRRER